VNIGPTLSPAARSVCRKPGKVTRALGKNPQGVKNKKDFTRSIGVVLLTLFPRTGLAGLTEYRFTPSEAQVLTGVSQTQQRDWRRHRHIPADVGGLGGFDLQGLCTLFILKASNPLGAVSRFSGMASEMSAPLAEYVAAVASGAAPRQLSNCGLITDAWEASTHDSIQAAVDEHERQRLATNPNGLSSINIVPLQAIAAPFAIRVGDYLKARA
jgi:hypothetical protein